MYKCLKSNVSSTSWASLQQERTWAYRWVFVCKRIIHRHVFEVLFQMAAEEVFDYFQVEV